VQTKKFSKGDVIFQEGDESSEAYRLLAGEVEITISTVGGPKALARLSSGEFFGEMSLIDDKPRSATATALADCEVEVFHEENFSTRVLGDPGNLHHYVRTLLDRIRSTDALLQWHLNKVSPGGQPKASAEAVLRGPAGQMPPAASPTVPVRLRLTSTTNLGTGTDLNITKIPFRIGRVTQGGHGLSPLAPNDLSVPDEKPYHVSRNHCVIERSGDSYLVRDFGSRSGTIVNGTPIGISFDAFVAPLKPGENTLVLGAHEGPHHFNVVVL
jgi:CRP-like cAMP-binding protein